MLELKLSSMYVTRHFGHIIRDVMKSIRLHIFLLISLKISVCTQILSYHFINADRIIHVLQPHVTYIMLVISRDIHVDEVFYLY